MTRNPSRRRPKSRIITAAITLGLALTAGPVNRRAAASSNDDDAAAVHAALVRSAAGFERGDLGMLNKVYADDESVTIFESGHANYGWADYRDNHLVPEMREFKNTKYTLSDIKIKASGNTAWATYKYALAGDLKDRRLEVTGLGTAVLEKRGGDWRIVHTHTSAPRRAPAAASAIE